MAELESSLTAIDWLVRLKVGVTGDQSDRSWSDTARRMLDTTSMCENPAVTSAHATESTSGGNRKPGYSYSSLIYLAIGSSAERRMTLSEIYAWICDRFPYYRTADSGWKVSPHFRMHACGECCKGCCKFVYCDIARVSYTDVTFSSSVMPVGTTEVEGGHTPKLSKHTINIISHR